VQGAAVTAGDDEEEEGEEEQESRGVGEKVVWPQGRKM
jgi:hypothetical protein